MKTMKIILFGLILVVPLILGCGQRPMPEGLPKLYPLALDLFQDDQPLVEATVSLYPADSTSKWSSGGFSDNNGRAVIVTHGGFDGAPVGKYKVAVVKSIIEGAPESMDDQGNSQSFTLIETQYTNRNTTPLEIEVQSGQNSLRLDVGKAVKIKRN
ncbi:MAG: hypothetical protein FWD31_13650 [Planctomycetaceae bacterium]|nr:hypothetical protein [Planctomycetaceae bacterium]